MNKGSHNIEEINWAKETLTTIGKKFAYGDVTYYDLCRKYEDKFGKRLSTAGLYGWLKRLENPDGQKKYDKAYREKRKAGLTKTKSDKEVIKTFEKSTYVLFVPPLNICGFDTIEQVTEFIKENNISGEMKLFKSVSINVDIVVNVSVGQ